MSRVTQAPGTLPLGAALDRSEPLARLMQRLRASRECFDAIVPALPLPMRNEVRAGPLDDGICSLLVANGAVAAKIRQLLPLLEDRLRAQGLPVTSIKVRVQPPSR